MRGILKVLRGRSEMVSAYPIELASYRKMSMAIVCRHPTFLCIFVLKSQSLHSRKSQLILRWYFNYLLGPLDVANAKSRAFVPEIYKSQRLESYVSRGIKMMFFANGRKLFGKAGGQHQYVLTHHVYLVSQKVKLKKALPIRTTLFKVEERLDPATMTDQEGKIIKDNPIHLAQDLMAFCRSILFIK